MISKSSSDVFAGAFSVNEDIGEGVELGPDGICSNKYLIPNSNKTECILPQRIDIGKHFIMTGGVDATREFHENMVSRVSSFGVYMIDAIEQYPVVNDLFLRDSFQKVAKEVCPPNKQILDPFQFNFIIQIPGQTVALHLDAPYFWGASRFQLPQWLLVAMEFSNLFADRFIDQVQIVGYLHDRIPEAGDGGDFVYYPDNSGYRDVPSFPLSASAVDGSKVIHAATIYRSKFPGKARSYGMMGTKSGVSLLTRRWFVCTIVRTFALASFIEHAVSATMKKSPSITKSFATISILIHCHWIMYSTGLSLIL